MQFGEIDSTQILENEFNILVLQRTLDVVLRRAGILIRPYEIEQIRQDVLKIMQEKHPNSGISLKKRRQSGAA